MDPTLGIGVTGCSSFALRAMVPALANCKGVRLVAIASRDLGKATEVAKKYGCQAHGNYDEIVARPDVDAIYMPLPTGLHEEWGMRVLSSGKHLLAEKSFAVDFSSAKRMVDVARDRGLLILENFLFLRHSQISWVRQRLDSGSIGEPKFFRAAFTIPPLDGANFRYQAGLGGGALLDAGGYMVRSARAFLGDDIELLNATMEYSKEHGVDTRGTATFRSSSGVMAQVLWGFDTHYQCTWEFLGTNGRILCERALTPPPGFEPPVRIESGSEKQDIKLPPDNHYVNQWNYFASSIRNPQAYEASYYDCLQQAKYLDAVREMSR